MLSLAALALSLAAALAAALVPSGGDPDYDRALMRVLEQSFPAFSETGVLPHTDRQLFADVLKSPAFVHDSIGPFDVYVMLADDLAAEKAAQKTLEQAIAGLTPLVPIMTVNFGRPEGLISGKRIKLVLCAADGTREANAFDALIALLDHCEAGPGSWTDANGTLWTDALRQSPVVRTWDVQLFNLNHPDLKSQGKALLEHQLGYFTLAHLVHGLIRQGSWGLSPPWLDQGLIDELDIEAYGESWVGEEKWTSTTEGWFRAGWSGFLPEGAAPPAPVTGPPADLATTVRETGDGWARRSKSATRHWSDLAADLGSAAPASLAFTAEHGSFLPRDRAYARCVMHLLLVVAPPDGPSLLEALDHPSETLRSGMFAAEPLTALFSAQLGGVPEADALAAMPLGEKLDALGHPEIAARIRALGAEGALDVADHREQGNWLYGQMKLDMAARSELFQLFLTAEYYEQMQAWKSIGAALDTAMKAALKASPNFPDTLAQKEAVAKAFRGALAH